MKKFILLSLLAITQVLGDIWLSRGMKQFGAIDAFSPALVMQLGIYVFTNPWIWLGIAFLVTSLFLYLTAISRLDLSYVLPIHASSYVLNACFAWAILGENITARRWMSTVLIAIGVMVVGFSKTLPPNTAVRKSKADTEQSEYVKSQKSKLLSHQKVQQKFLPWLFFPLGFHFSQTWLAVMIVALADASGDLLLAMGMKRIGKIELQPVSKILKQIYQIAINPTIISGIVCQGIAFFAFILVLTWADISFVRPATALTYIFSLLGAKYILKERVNAMRLVGIIFVGIGILLHR